MLISEQRFRAPHVDGKVVVDEEYGDFPLLPLLKGFQRQELIDHAFVGAEANGVAEEAGHGAELAAIRTATAGLDWNQMKALPGHAQSAAHAADELGKVRDHVELIEVHAFPPDLRVPVERRFFSWPNASTGA